MKTQIEWIPIKTRTLSSEERNYYAEQGYDDVTWEYACSLPDDGEEVLITTSYGDVQLTTFYNDVQYVQCGCYFEQYEDRDDVVAWARIEPYKGEINEED